MSASFLLSLVRRGAGVAPEASARPRMPSRADEPIERLDDAGAERDDVLESAAGGARAQWAGTPGTLSEQAGPLATERRRSRPDFRGERAMAPPPVEPAVHPHPSADAHERPHVQTRASAPKNRRVVSERTTMTSRIQRTGHSAAVPARPAAAITAVASSALQAIARHPLPAMAAATIDRPPDVVPVVPWMPRRDASAHAVWPEPAARAQENRVEVRIGRIEIVQPPAPSPVCPPAKRRPRGFGDLQPARRYLDRQWY